jgi:uncharacterized protein
MKKIAAFFPILLLSAISGYGQTNPAYDKKLADSLKGNDNGMRTYTLVLLRTGPAQITDKKITDSLFRSHMANINKLAEAGKLTVAGPLQKNDKSYRGIFIFTTSQEEARELMKGDGAIQAGMFEAELYTWFGSAALPMYLPYHDKITKNKE